MLQRCHIRSTLSVQMQHPDIHSISVIPAQDTQAPSSASDRPTRYMGVGPLLEQPSHHDLTVRVGSRPHTFLLQRCIVSRNSEYFTNCPSSLELPSHDPATISLLFRWLYTGHIWTSAFKTVNPWIDLSARLFAYACEFQIESLKSVSMGYCVRSLAYADYDQDQAQNWRLQVAVISLVGVYQVGKRYVDVFFDSIVRKGRIREILGSTRIREALLAKPEVMMNLMDAMGTIIEERLEYQPYRRL